MDRAILIIRNPLECFLSEVNRNLVSPFEYFNYAPIEAFDQYQDLDDLFHSNMFHVWKIFHQRILTYFKKPLLIVEYKNLKTNMIEELTKVIQFLDHEMTEDIKRCLQQIKVWPFQRPKRPKHEVDEIMNRIKKEHIDAYELNYNVMVKKLQTTFQHG